jgi:hypothetical protein
LPDGRQLIVADEKFVLFPGTDFEFPIFLRRTYISENRNQWWESKKIHPVGPLGGWMLSLPNARETTVSVLPNQWVIQMDGAFGIIFLRLAPTPELLSVAPPIPIIFPTTQVTPPYGVPNAYGPSIDMIRAGSDGYYIDFHVSQWTNHPPGVLPDTYRTHNIRLTLPKIPNTF